MSTFRVVYYLAMIMCLGICIAMSRHNRSIRIFIPLLFCAILTEVMSDLINDYNRNGSLKSYLYVPYHIYVLIEYGILSTYFARYWRNYPVSRIIRGSLLVFCLLNVLLSVYVRGLNTLPSIQYNIEGFLNIVLAIGTLFYLPVDEERPIFIVPMFWLCTALLVYHPSIFLLNGSYNFLKRNHHQVAVSVIGNINYSLNYLYYIIISIAFLCSRSTKKS